MSDEETTALTSPLPGEADVDADLLDQAVVHLNRVYTVKGLETAREVGEYVLTTFFEGDPENFRSRGDKHATFGELAKRDDLHMSAATIWRMVSVVDQLRMLPEDIQDALPFTHHTLLLPLKDEKTKVKLAERAADKGWTKRQLEEEVRKARQKEKGDSQAGRPPIPVFAKGLGKMLKAIDLATSEEIPADPFERGYTADKAKKLIADVEAHIAKLDALKAKIQEKIDASEGLPEEA